MASFGLGPKLYFMLVVLALYGIGGVTMIMIMTPNLEIALLSALFGGIALLGVIGILFAS